MSEARPLTNLLVSESGSRTRSLRITPVQLRLAVLGAVLAFLLAVLFVGSWWYLAAKARHAHLLEEEVTVLLAREARIEELVRTMAEVEAGYERIRLLFGGDAAPAGNEIWLPPAATARPQLGSSPAVADEARPTSWPLTERGFVTQTLLEDGGSDHPGIDIAVPSGSYIRAAGSGVVVEAGEDPIYGNYLVLDHGGGYRSLYAHASLLTVARGDSVRRNEVVALSGSTGRSTAPHLHFEILLDGEPIDPLTMVSPP
jgi:murein DD-endopeptidase MepM/ murein hydrolase activator NlpD